MSDITPIIRPRSIGLLTLSFEALPYGRASAAVRRWDDQAKDPAVTSPRFEHFAPLLAALVRT